LENVFVKERMLFVLKQFILLRSEKFLEDSTEARLLIAEVARLLQESADCEARVSLRQARKVMKIDGANQKFPDSRFFKTVKLIMSAIDVNIL
jgi:hypothetical protein